VRLWGAGAYEREAIDGSQTRYSHLFRAEVGDIIVNKIWARNGSVAVIRGPLAGCYGSAEFPMFAPSPDRLEPLWMHWLTKTHGFWEQCDEKSRGTSGKNRIRPERFLEIEIPLPPLAEQQRIVARIEELAALIDEARALRRLADGETAALLVSATEDALCSGSGKGEVRLPETNQAVRRGVAARESTNEVAGRWSVPAGWVRATVAELLLCGALLDVKDGNHGSNHPRSVEFVAEGVPFLMASDIRNGEVAWNEARRLGPATTSRLHVGFSRAGDVLFTHKASIGKTAIADRECILSPQVTYYRCNREFIEPRWLEAFLGSPLFLMQLSSVRAQSTRDFVSISKQYRQSVLLPPLAEQRRIVAEVAALRAGMDRAKRLQAETACELDALLPSILDRAFKAEL
jgi:type I restriction enzyme S subunit